MYFAENALNELATGFKEIEPKYLALREAFVRHPYKTERGREYGTHGFGRRIGTLARCIQRVFSDLPPDQAGLPQRETLLDVSISLQAMVTNVSGCLDNLTWTWVLERSVVQADGSALEQKMVGLGRRYKHVWKSFPPPFRDYLKSRDPWFAHVKGFRDSLAHRIPLYIPPYSVDPKNQEQYYELERLSWTELCAGNIENHESLKKELEKLKFFRPIIAHSLVEGSPLAVFHAQVLADFKTVEELGWHFLDEMKAVG
ncbi:hypothetical protein IB277_07105 [Ensifer sp. ENS07]|uniref:hypothetical protein n=1 Tax=Ensifer sp. ENS07 TaxID=2769274 RepID=UPI001785BE2D|nr:hypothetical protein [Ensifer sp. ENS07]MBD9636060.1 hypothetical protein [Ensifer sp. ENS07]